MTRTTFQEHARLQRKVINLDRGGTNVMCVWMDCDRDGFENNKIVLHDHARWVPCDSSLARHCTLIFCTDRHKQYFLACSGPMARDTEARNNGHIAGMLPPGFKGYMS